MYRIGFGTDIHRLVSGRPLILGGVEIESDLGAEGHSDADALTHAITDAILGAVALGDIGSHFPDTDERWHGADSFVFLRQAVASARSLGYIVVNLDSTISLQSPKLQPHIDKIRDTIAGVLKVDRNCISVKAKTGEGVDAVGERRAIRAESIVLLKRTNL